MNNCAAGEKVWNFFQISLPVGRYAQVSHVDQEVSLGIQRNRIIN